MVRMAQAWLKLFRLHNAVIVGAGVWLGYASLHSPRPELALAIWGCWALALLTMAGNADNDICDVEADRINRPRRPLPTGLVKAGPARVAAWGLYGLGIAAAARVSWLHGLLAAGMALLLVIYNRRFKGQAVIGNLSVSLLCALAIYFPEFPTRPWLTVPACVFAFLATWAREIVKDIEDLPGDEAVGLKTLPAIAGKNAARKLAFCLVALLLALLPMPSAYFDYGKVYAAFSVILVAPILLALLWELFKSNPNYRRCQRQLKGLMLGGMLALLAGVL
jgi:geranylgeranylglycerol-phosphate geranylgeranyltransferase